MFAVHEVMRPGKLHPFDIYPGDRIRCICQQGTHRSTTLFGDLCKQMSELLSRQCMTADGIADFGIYQVYHPVGLWRYCDPVPEHLDNEKFGGGSYVATPQVECSGYRKAFGTAKPERYPLMCHTEGEAWHKADEFKTVEAKKRDQKIREAFFGEKFWSIAPKSEKGRDIFIVFSMATNDVEAIALYKLEMANAGREDLRKACLVIWNIGDLIYHPPIAWGAKRRSKIVHTRFAGLCRLAFPVHPPQGRLLGSSKTAVRDLGVVYGAGRPGRTIRPLNPEKLMDRVHLLDRKIRRPFFLHPGDSVKCICLGGQGPSQVAFRSIETLLEGKERVERLRFVRLGKVRLFYPEAVSTQTKPIRPAPIETSFEKVMEKPRVPRCAIAAEQTFNDLEEQRSWYAVNFWSYWMGRREVIFTPLSCLDEVIKWRSRLNLDQDSPHIRIVTFHTGTHRELKQLFSHLVRYTEEPPSLHIEKHSLGPKPFILRPGDRIRTIGAFVEALDRNCVRALVSHLRNVTGARSTRSEGVFRIGRFEVYYPHGLGGAMKGPKDALPSFETARFPNSHTKLARQHALRKEFWQCQKGGRDVFIYLGRHEQPTELLAENLLRHAQENGEGSYSCHLVSSKLGRPLAAPPKSWHLNPFEPALCERVADLWPHLFPVSPDTPPIPPSIQEDIKTLLVPRSDLNNRPVIKALIAANSGVKAYPGAAPTSLPPKASIRFLGPMGQTLFRSVAELILKHNPMIEKEQLPGILVLGGYRLFHPAPSCTHSYLVSKAPLPYTYERPKRSPEFARLFGRRKVKPFGPAANPLAPLWHDNDQALDPARTKERQDFYAQTLWQLEPGPQVFITTAESLMETLLHLAALNESLSPPPTLTVFRPEEANSLSDLRDLVRQSITSPSSDS